MAIKAIVLDLDFTLLKRNKTVGERTLESLIEAHEQGYTLIIATSRPIRVVRGLVPAELLERTTLITLNGAVVHEFTRDHQWQMSCLGLEAKHLVAALREQEPPIQITAECWGENFATNREYCAETLRAKQHAQPDMVKSLDDIDYGWLSKITADGQGNSLEHLLAWQDDYSDLRFIPADDHRVINIVPASVGKSKTVEQLLARMNIAPTDVVAFGDEIPDIRLLELVGLGIAMGNAKPEVKAVADLVIGDCDDDPIADFLQVSLLKQAQSA
ncbi:HAD-IIB family hydrolase [Salinispirillum sp. LH 10-3-1]|uniref:HAD-IIB family hydrolase n=1 Tax=Salinispirillum sp. LH 10-3-1 TaxID=2952525 RepID=A0AB38YC52_9GAMM